MNDIRKEYQRLQLFERVCMRCSGELQQFIFTLTRHDRFAMEEIYQNTMLGALRGLHYLRDCRRMKAWIFAIARAEARRYYAEILLKNKVLYYAEGEESYGYFIDFTKLVEDRETVQILISSLTDVERKLCEMHYFEGHSFKEISELLDLNYNTIRSMHIRGMAKMKNVCMKKTKMTNPDIALIDIKMPGMDGIEVASQLKLIGILTVLMTAYSPAEKFL